MAGSAFPLADLQEVAMSGPYGQDVEAVLLVGGCFILILAVASVVEACVEARDNWRRK